MRLSLCCVLAVASCGGGPPESPGADPGATPLAAPAERTQTAAAAPREEAPEAERPPAADEAPTEELTVTATLTPVAGSVRVVVLHGGALLASEERQVERFMRGVGRGRSAERATPDGAEVAAAERWLEGTGHDVPEAWASSERVVVLRFGPIEERRSGARVSGGVVGVVVLRPGADEPTYSERVAQDPPPGCGTCQRPRFRGQDWASFVDALLDTTMEAP